MIENHSVVAIRNQATWKQHGFRQEPPTGVGPLRAKTHDECARNHHNGILDERTEINKFKRNKQKEQPVHTRTTVAKPATEKSISGLMNQDIQSAIGRLARSDSGLRSLTGLLELIDYTAGIDCEDQEAFFLLLSAVWNQHPQDVIDRALTARGRDEAETPRKYSTSLCGELYSGEFDSIESAVEKMIATGREEFFVGENRSPQQPETYWHAEDWLQQVSCGDEYVGDWGDSTLDQREEVEAKVRPILGTWLDRYNLCPVFWFVEKALKFQIAGDRIFVFRDGVKIKSGSLNGPLPDKFYVFSASEPEKKADSSDNDISEKEAMRKAEKKNEVKTKVVQLLWESSIALAIAETEEEAERMKFTKKTDRQT